MIVMIVVRVVSPSTNVRDGGAFLDHRAITPNANAFPPGLRQADRYGGLHECSALTAPFRIGAFQCCDVTWEDERSLQRVDQVQEGFEARDDQTSSAAFPCA